MRENAVRRSQIRYQAGSWNFTGSTSRLIEVESRRNPEGRTQGPAWTAVLEFQRGLRASDRSESRKRVGQSPANARCRLARHGFLIGRRVDIHGRAMSPPPNASPGRRTERGSRPKCHAVRKS